MTSTRLMIAASLIGTTVACAGSNAMAIAVNTGIYNAYTQLTAVVASGGATCPAVGDAGGPPAIFYYPGPSASGAVAYSTTFIAGLKQYYMIAVTYPATAPANVNTWKGTAHVTIPGLGVDIPFSFSGTSTVTSPNAYTSVGKLVIPGSNNMGTCTETTASYNIRIGK